MPMTGFLLVMMRFRTARGRLSRADARILLCIGLVLSCTASTALLSRLFISPLSLNTLVAKAPYHCGHASILYTLSHHPSLSIHSFTHLPPCATALNSTHNGGQDQLQDRERCSDEGSLGRHRQDFPVNMHWCVDNILLANTNCKELTRLCTGRYGIGGAGRQSPCLLRRVVC